MKHDLSILFLLRKSKENEKETAHIYLRITVNGERSEISTNRRVEISKWDSNLQRAKGRSEASRTLNEYLDNLENQVKRNFNVLLDRNDEITAFILRGMILGTYQKEYYLVQVFETNNKLVEQEEGDKYSRSTIDQYRTTLDRIKLFLQKEYDCNDIPLSKLDVLFIRRFEIFLKTAYGIDHNTIMKHLKQLKKVIHFAMSLNYIVLLWVDWHLLY